MPVETVINVDNVSKKFCRSLKRVMAYGAKDIARNLAGLSSLPEVLREGEFWAVDNISFELRRGETLGIIGSNGSGKSTMLKMLNGIFMPDKGRIKINGRVGALIEVGAGFHPMLTGRENIYINGAILGMSRKEIGSKFDEIVNFAGVGNFIDTPVKYYSSGMFAKLGFSIAVHVNPEILLIDEVLSVGDIKFQNKAHQKILEIRDKSSIIFVSHNLGAVSLLCDYVIWLNNGKIRASGPASNVISEYSKISMQEFTNADSENFQDANKTVSGDIYINKIELLDTAGCVKEVFDYGEDLIIRCHYKASRFLGQPYFLLEIGSPKTGILFGANTFSDEIKRPVVDKGEGFVDCYIKSIPLHTGYYTVDIHVIPELGVGKLFRHLMAKSFFVENRKFNSSGKLSTVFGNRGPVFVPYEWKF